MNILGLGWSWWKHHREPGRGDFSRYGSQETLRENCVGRHQRFVLSLKFHLRLQVFRLGQRSWQLSRLSCEQRTSKLNSLRPKARGGACPAHKPLFTAEADVWQLRNRIDLGKVIEFRWCADSTVEMLYNSLRCPNPNFLWNYPASRTSKRLSRICMHTPSVVNLGLQELWSDFFNLPDQCRALSWIIPSGVHSDRGTSVTCGYDQKRHFEFLCLQSVQRSLKPTKTHQIKENPLSLKISFWMKTR